MQTRHSAAFTLVELLVVISIIATLATLASPLFHKMVERADNVACLNQLRQIGISVQLYVADNDNRFPKIETNPANPVYPEEEGAVGMLEALEPYGLTEGAMICPADRKSLKAINEYGSSYEWRPMVDEELASAPVIYGRRGALAIPPGRVRLVVDYFGVHNGGRNWLYADGKVKGAGR